MRRGRPCVNALIAEPPLLLPLLACLSPGQRVAEPLDVIRQWRLEHQPRTRRWLKQ